MVHSRAHNFVEQFCLDPVAMEMAFVAMLIPYSSPTFHSRPSSTWYPFALCLALFCTRKLFPWSNCINESMTSKKTFSFANRVRNPLYVDSSWLVWTWNMSCANPVDELAAEPVCDNIEPPRSMANINDVMGKDSISPTRSRFRLDNPRSCHQTCLGCVSVRQIQG